MNKTIFQSLSIVGIVAIIIMAFTIPSNPYQIIPAITIMGFDKPLWFAIIISFGFIYLSTLWSIYDKIEEKK